MINWLDRKSKFFFFFPFLSYSGFIKGWKTELDSLD